MFAVTRWPCRRIRSLIAPIAFGFVMLNLFGCRGEDEITKTTERRIDYSEKTKEDSPKLDKVATRILGIIAPGEEGQSWFFKLMGPADGVTKEQAAFDTFLSSIEFPKKGDKPVTWTLPEGWREGPKKGRYATILVGPADEPIELTVMSAGGDLLANVNRWRGQPGSDRARRSRPRERRKNDEARRQDESDRSKRHGGQRTANAAIRQREIQLSPRLKQRFASVSLACAAGSEPFTLLDQFARQNSGAFQDEQCRNRSPRSGREW
jgi:hypothetical protein